MLMNGTADGTVFVYDANLRRITADDAGGDPLATRRRVADPDDRRRRDDDEGPVQPLLRLDAVGRWRRDGGRQRPFGFITMWPWAFSCFVARATSLCRSYRTLASTGCDRGTS